MRLEHLPTRIVGGITAHVATTPRARLLGLALMDRPADGTALLFPRCRSVHTFGMRFAIDLWWLDEDDRVVDIVRGVPPNRVVSNRAARSVVELVARADDLLEPHRQGG